MDKSTVQGKSHRRGKNKNWKKMIYRKWSLLTGPAAILAGIVGTVVVADLLFVENDWLHKTDEKKQDSTLPTKLAK